MCIRDRSQGCTIFSISHFVTLCFDLLTIEWSAKFCWVRTSTKLLRVSAMAEPGAVIEFFLKRPASSITDADGDPSEDMPATIFEQIRGPAPPPPPPRRSVAKSPQPPSSDPPAASKAKDSNNMNELAPSRSRYMISAEPRALTYKLCFRVTS